MLVEAAVLDGHHGLLHGIRNLIGLHRMAALLIDIGQGVAFSVQDGAHARGIAVGEILNIRLHRFVGPGYGHTAHTRDGG